MTQAQTPPQASGIERRLSLRILAYWRDLRGDNAFPSVDDITPQDMGDMWPCCLILKVDGHANDPLITHCGDSFEKMGIPNVANKLLSAAPSPSLVANGFSYFGKVLEKRVPITFGGEFINKDNVRILYRSAILPLSRNNETIDHLLAAANCREDKGTP